MIIINMLLLKIKNKEFLMLEFLLNEWSHKDWKLSFNELIIDFEIADINLKFLENHVIVIIIIIMIIVYIEIKLRRMNLRLIRVIG